MEPFILLTVPHCVISILGTLFGTACSQLFYTGRFTNVACTFIAAKRSKAKQSQAHQSKEGQRSAVGSWQFFNGGAEPLFVAVPPFVVSPCDKWQHQTLPCRGLATANVVVSKRLQQSSCHPVFVAECNLHWYHMEQAPHLMAHDCRTTRYEGSQNKKKHDGRHWAADEAWQCR